MRQNSVKQLLRSGKPAVGTWLSLGSITAARFMARAGFAWLTVDTEHTATGTETAANMLAVLQGSGLTGHRNGVDGLAFSPGGRLLATCGMGSLRVWNLATGQVQQTLTKLQSPPPGGGVQPDGRLLASCGWGSKKGWLWPSPTVRGCCR